MTAGPKQEIGPAQDPSLPRGRGETILVVEDDASLRRLAGIQLRSLGYIVLEAEDGAAALQLLEREQKIKLLLTDVIMPGALSGAELGQEAHKLQPDLKLMYMSGFPRIGPDGQLPENALLLRKPFRLREIAVRVSQALGR